MNKVFFPSLLFCFVLQLLRVTQEFCAEFDERLWEKIGENQISAGSGNGGLAGLYIDPQQIFSAVLCIPRQKEVMLCRTIHGKENMNGLIDF